MSHSVFLFQWNYVNKLKNAAHFKALQWTFNAYVTYYM